MKRLLGMSAGIGIVLLGVFTAAPAYAAQTATMVESGDAGVRNASHCTAYLKQYYQVGPKVTSACYSGEVGNEFICHAKLAAIDVADVHATWACHIARVW